jgi:YjjW family glycine radical enzyme activase
MKVSPKGIINRIIDFSAVDGPGNRTVIFFQGCNFNCTYCHNPETINFCTSCGICAEHCPGRALDFSDNTIRWNAGACTDCDTCLRVCPNGASPKTTIYTAEALLDAIRKNLPFISGITISGGECTLQYDFISEFLELARERGISAFIDTNGHLHPDRMKKLSRLFDKAMLDIKAFAEDSHRKLTGASPDYVLANARQLLQNNKLYEIRSLVAVGLDNEYTVDKVSRLIASYNPDLRYKIIAYRPHGVRNPDVLKPPSADLIAELSEKARNNGCRNVITV